MTAAELTPEALARMEAKLLADVEVLRKMRALLESHGTTLGAMIPAAAPLPPAIAAAPAPAPATPAAPAEPALPRKSHDELQMEALATLGGQTFLMETLRKAIYKLTRHYPDTSSLKVFVNRLIREGKVTVEDRRTGRNGSLYRCHLPAPAAPEAACADTPGSTGNLTS